MNITKHCLPALLAGLLAAGAHAQSTSAVGSSDLPPKAGEASTQSNGTPNAATTNSPVTEAPLSTKDMVRQEANGRDRASATTNVPGKAGEATTSVRGQPNADPNDPRLAKSRAELRDERMMQRAQNDAARAAQMMGSPGYGSSVFQGGTPD